VSKTYCSHCEKEYQPEEHFCPFCGQKIESDLNIDEETGLIISDYEPEIDLNNPPRKRNYWKWFFISFFTFGIGGIVYLINKYQDIEKLGKNIKNPFGVYKNLTLPVIITLVFCCSPGIIALVEIFQLYYSYLTIKYLKKYLTSSPHKIRNYYLNYTLVLLAKITNLILVVTCIILVVLFRNDWSAYTFMIIGIVFGSIFVIMSLIVVLQMATWQKAYNTYIETLVVV
jgi:hypothetical protein